jgi:hypothetical protein
MEIEKKLPFPVVESHLREPEPLEALSSFKELWTQQETFCNEAVIEGYVG